jgi:hypothetical protein
MLSLFSYSHYRQILDSNPHTQGCVKVRKLKVTGQVLAFLGEIVYAARDAVPRDPFWTRKAGSAASTLG